MDTRIILNFQLRLIPPDRVCFITHIEHVLFIYRDITNPRFIRQITVPRCAVFYPFTQRRTEKALQLLLQFAPGHVIPLHIQTDERFGGHGFSPSLFSRFSIFSLFLCSSPSIPLYSTLISPQKEKGNPLMSLRTSIGLPPLLKGY